MGLFSTLLDFKQPYTAGEAWVYDHLIAPGVSSFHGPFLDGQLDALPEGARLLEVGCGGGQLLIELAERRPDLSLVGLDLSEGQVARARRRTARFDGRVRCVVGSALDLPFEDARFDGLISVACLKHWPDPQRGLSECARVLRPGGRMLVIEADRSCRPEDAQAFVESWKVPSPLTPASRVFFRMVVADRAPALDELEAWSEGLPLEEVCVRRVPHAPAIVLEGRRR
ncbi:MAG: class I SAM-dependent methyltransferase [Deltaproteobacteria bacterium]|nr:class I SAM-dependent methyltransferase [Deltaproteobacteria bacterium]